MDKIKVLEHLKTKQCESDPYKPKIWCDDVVELEDIFESSEEYSDIATTTEFYEEFEGIEERFQTRFGGVMDNKRSQECTGALKITHMTSNSNLFVLEYL